VLVLKDLVRCSNDELKALDLAEVNCACASGLPDASAAVEKACLAAVGEFAGIVKEYTEANLPRWPDMAVETSQRRFSEVLPREVEQDSLLLAATENLLNPRDFEEHWWGRLARACRWGRRS
jgi:hypothetical protein